MRQKSFNQVNMRKCIFMDQKMGHNEHFGSMITVCGAAVTLGDKPEWKSPPTPSLRPLAGPPRPLISGSVPLGHLPQCSSLLVTVSLLLRAALLP